MPTKPRQLDPVSARLHAKQHQHSLEEIDKQDAAARACQRIVSKYASRIIAALPEQDSYTLVHFRVKKLAEPFWQEMARTIYDELLKVHKWSHRETAEMLIDVVPPLWWRKIEPRLPLREATGDMPLAGFGIPPIVPPTAVAAPAPSPDDENKKPEPVIPAMNSAEWEELVSQVVFPPPDKDTLSQIIYGGGVTGNVNWPARLGMISRQRVNPEQMAATIATSLSQGADLKDVARDIRDQFQAAGSDAARMARTEAHRVNLATQGRSFAALGDLQYGAQYVATLDANVRPDHAIHHGQVFQGKFMVPGISSASAEDAEALWDGEELPDTLNDFNCRCLLTLVLQPPEEIEDDESLAADFRNAADEQVSDPSAYDDWFDQATEQQRRLAVGSGRYRAMLDIVDRDPEWSDFIDGESGNLMSTAELQAESQVEREARKRAVDELIAKRAAQLNQVRAGGFLQGAA